MTEPVTRRDFLKVVGAGLAAAPIIPLLSACTPEEEVIKPEYNEISEGGSLNLRVGENEKTSNVVISYKESGELPTGPLRVRIINGEARYIPFQNGEARVRKVGEILEPRLLRVCKSHELRDEITVGVYREATTPVSMTQKERINLPDGDNIYGLPVVTALADWMDEADKPQFEINSHQVGESWENLDKFGRGYAVGELNSIDGEYSFKVLGYVFDSRAVEVVGSSN